MDSFAFFVQEMQKIAVSKDRLLGAQVRVGRRPMSVDTLLRKEKDGSLYRNKVADAIGIEEENGRKRYLSSDEAEKRLESLRQTAGGLPENIFSSFRHMFASGLLEGGLAERAGKKPNDFDPYELADGTETEEEEHTDDLATARQIAMDHLTEHPKYYEALHRMEGTLDKEEAGEKKAWAKLADSWKPQWLELSSAPNDYFMQPTAPVRGKKARGDVPSVEEGLTEGQTPRTPASYAQPTNNAMPMKEAAAWAKVAKSAVMGPQVRSPTDTVPDVSGPQNRMQMQTERITIPGSAPDAQALTGSSSDAYQRA